MPLRCNCSGVPGLFIVLAVIGGYRLRRDEMFLKCFFFSELCWPDEWLEGCLFICLFVFGYL